jgi:dienelactone hydrolase
MTYLVYVLKILVCHGALDPHVPITEVNAFVQEMNEACADWQLIVFGGAMHGITHETGAAVPGVAYRPTLALRLPCIASSWNYSAYSRSHLAR